MNKYFSKALFYTERWNRNLSMIAYSALFLWGISDLLHRLRLVKVDPAYWPPFPSDLFRVNYQVFVCICIASVVYSYFQKDKKYYFMLTQSYSRDSIMITKTISFIISYLIPTIIYGVVSLIILVLNKKYYLLHNRYSGLVYEEAMTGLLLSILAIIAVLTLVTMLIEFMEMCFGKTSAVVILSLVLWGMLFYASSVMNGFISKRLGVLKHYIRVATNFLFGQGQGVLMIQSNPIKYRTLSLLAWEYFQSFNLIISITLIILSLIIFYINIKLNRKVSAESTSNIFMFKFSERAFKVITSFFITIVGSLVFSAAIYYTISFISGSNYSTVLISKYGLAGKENIEQTIYLVLNILWIPLCVFIYKVFGKILSKRGTLQC